MKKQNKSRAFTKDEVINKFIRYAHEVAKYWAELSDNKTNLERCEGAIFSLLVAFDGESMELPRMEIVLRPHPDDKEFCKNEGLDWFSDGMIINNNCALHEKFAMLKAKRRK